MENEHEKNSMLRDIQREVQQAAEAIAAVLGMEVTIVDDAMGRVAGTGRYSTGIGEIVDRSSAFEGIFQTGRGIIIEDPGRHQACLSCGMRERCPEEAEMCTPIKAAGKMIGIIALVAFSPEQKDRLLQERDKLFAFIDRMADLLASKAAERERMAEVMVMKNQMETLINAVGEGIIATDDQGRIISLNAAAQRITGLEADAGVGLRIEVLFPSLSIGECVKGKQEIIAREVSGVVNGKAIHCMAALTPWYKEDMVRGVVITLQEMAAVRKIVSQYSRSTEPLEELIMGNSDAMEQVKKVARVAAQTHASVLIRGESGAGKELFARTIHQLSDRGDKPFVAINCAAIPETLLESELFGYDEGAFTGARKGGKPGKFELAHGGTLFLDEIGDMSLAIQAKLLRVLQDKTFERVGGTGSIRVDVRIISATHKDMEAMVEAGTFRQDLYYRVNVFPLLIPPLRHRREDLPGLIRHFLEKYRDSLEKTITDIEPEGYGILLSYDWPGNVRELENVMEYLVNVETGPVIATYHVASRIRRKPSQVPDVQPLAELEKNMIVAALEKYGLSLAGKERAAAALGISKATLYRKIKEYTGQDELLKAR